MVQPRATPWRLSQDVSACSRSARSSGSRFAVAGLISLRSASSAANCSREMSSWVSLRTEESSVWHSFSKATIARLAADAGLLISWAMPAASVPKVASESRCRAVDSTERAVR